MNENVLAWMDRLYAVEDDVLEEIRQRHERENLPPICISPNEAKIITVLLRAIGAKRVLEIGTLGGYSGTWIARALPSDGRLHTIECNPRHAAIARENFQFAGVSHKIDLIEGDALDVIRGLKPEFDAVFLDADKERLETYYRMSFDLLRIGGLLLCDNVFMNGRIADSTDEALDVEGARAFSRVASGDPRLMAATIPVRDGLAVGVKVAN
ncbi:MAG: O-methyltransferase [Gemmatimonadales bacterium]